MIHDAILSRKVLGQRLDMLFGSMGVDAANTSVAKAIPMAFPVTSAIFNVRERQVVERGLIERYVLEAVHKFGPINTAEIENLLGLEEEIARRVLQQAIELGQEIAVTKSGYSMKATTDFSAFQGEATHARRFIFNGVTGQVLPIDFAQVADEERLYPHEDGCEVYDMNGQKTRLRAYLKHHIHDERAGLMDVVIQGSAKRKQELGVPQELIEVSEQVFSQRETVWIPAFLLIDTAGSAEVRGMLAGGTTLLDERHATRDWLNKACKRRVSLVPKVDAKEFQKEVSDAFPGIVVLGTDDRNRVRLAGDEDAWETIRFSKPDKNSAWLAIALSRGYWWDTGRGEVVVLTPASPHAAKTLCLLRGIEQLHRLRGRYSANDERPTRLDWWREHVKDFFARLPEEMPQLDVSVSEFDNCVDRHPDTSLQDWYEEWE